MTSDDNNSSNNSNNTNYADGYFFDPETRKRKIFWTKNEKKGLICMVYCMADEPALTKRDFLNMVVPCDKADSDSDVEFECQKLSTKDFVEIFGNIDKDISPYPKWVVLRFFKEEKETSMGASPLKDFIPENDDKVKVWLTKTDFSTGDQIFNISNFDINNHKNLN